MVKVGSMDCRLAEDGGKGSSLDLEVEWVLLFVIR